MKNVIIGIVGSTLDRVKQNHNRWAKWRPTIVSVSQKNLPIDTYELICPSAKFEELAKQVANDIQEVSPTTTVNIHVIEFHDPWDFEEVFQKLYDFSQKLVFVPDKAHYYINITTGTHVAQICLYLLTESKHLPGKLLQVGVSDIPGQIGKVNIIDLDLNNYERIASRFALESHQSRNFLKSGINTKNRKFNQLIDRIETIAMKSKDPMLIMGHTGVGKTALARKIFELKKIKHKFAGRFVEVNCATLRGDSVMSTLFGHTKGSFTGAINNRIGLLKEAHHGVIFLDEIGELGLDEQASLLHAIEEKKFYAVGADKETLSDFQLIAGTNRDLNQLVKSGQFREDLLNRINLWTFILPSLRERKEDIAPNIEYELEKFAIRNEKKITFTKIALEKYIKFALSAEALWTGNFRDLNSSITRMATLTENGQITNDLVDEEILHLKNQWHIAEQKDFTLLDRYLNEQEKSELDLFDQHQLQFVIATCLESKNLAEAGRKLFGNSRAQKSTQNDSDRVRKYLKKFSINLDS